MCDTSREELCYGYLEGVGLLEIRVRETGRGSDLTHEIESNDVCISQEHLILETVDNGLCVAKRSDFSRVEGFVLSALRGHSAVSR